MPRLVSESNDNDHDDASRTSGCSRAVEDDKSNTHSYHSKTAESAADKLLSLAAVAADHGKSSSFEESSKATEKEEEDNETIASNPASSGDAVNKPSFDAAVSRQNNGGALCRMSPYPGMQGPVARFYGLGVMRPMYPGGASPAVSPAGDPRFVRRGGFPMWASPRPPFHPHAVPVRGPSPMHPAFRGRATPIYMTNASPSYEDDGSVNSRKRPSPQRVSLYPPSSTKSILKKKSGEGASASDENPSDAAKDVNEDNARSHNADEAAAKAEERKTTNTYVDSVVVERESPSSEDPATKKQRIISPASSNECQKGAEEDDLSSPQQPRRVPAPRNASSPAHFRPSPFGMGHHPHHPAHPRGPYAPPAMYPHSHGVRPYPVAMYPVAGSPGSGMFHRNMSARGRPGFPPMGPFYPRGRMAPSPSPTSMTRGEHHPCFEAGSSPSISKSNTNSAEDHGPSSSAPSSATSHAVRSMGDCEDSHSTAKRCVPLDQPLPSRQWRYV